ncbi:helix-turn-helix transcriptional regulator [Pedobacter arcticus]|uniref:helix-turn-helix transcriptional regulator n=1 Tax=Pedobacter arcticus TaxID=752140 RepID=UPI0002EF4B2D|nr:YafY family protein [Pedobacter arcticus]
MNYNDTTRLSRLTAILTQLQTKRLITSRSLAEKFGVSTRTIYGDIKALEKAGVPVITADGKGYSLMEGYKIPPIMFSESEANALITVEQLVLKNTDSSLIKEYTEAINKVKAVLLYSTKQKLELLSKRIAISPAISDINTSNSLALIQNALTDFKVLNLTYHSAHKNEKTERKIEPFALYYSLQESWTLIAYCQLRKDYRMFRLDKILKIKESELNFIPHKLTLQEYLTEKEKNFKTPDTLLSKQQITFAT